MATEYVLPFTGIEIEERLKEIEKLANTAVFCTEQSLTDEQKAIARANIGATAEGGSISWNDIKDKPFGESVEEVEVIAETVANEALPLGYKDSQSIKEGLTYAVYHNGERYECVAMLNKYGYPTLEAEPFKIFDDSYGAYAYIVFTEKNVTHTISVFAISQVTVPLPDKYIPDTIARVSDIPNIPDIPEPVTDKHINDLIDTKLTNTVKSVNGTEPDENGNVEINTESVLDANGKLLDSVLPDGYPHGEPGEDEVLLPECTVTDGCWVDAPALEDGKSYTVVLDGVEYSNLVANYYENTEEDEETGEEYVIASYFEIYHSKFTIYCNAGFDAWEISIRSEKEESIMTVFTGKPSTLVPMSKEYLPKVTAIADLTEAPTAEDFNNLLAALRAAGYMAE